MTVGFDFGTTNSLISVVVGDRVVDVTDVETGRPHPSVVRYEGEGGSEGVDPELEVSLSLENAPALTVLERMLEICGVDSACTWQIR